MQSNYFTCTFCGRPNSNGSPRAAGRCTTCRDSEGEALCDTCCSAHANKSAFKDHTCILTTATVHSRGEELLMRLGFEPAPRVCSLHGGLPFAGLTCAECAASTSVRNDLSVGNLCIACIKQHSASNPGHVLVPVHLTSDASSMRARLQETIGASVYGCFAASTVMDVLPCEADDVNDDLPVPLDSTSQSVDTPLVACARHKAVAIANELKSVDRFRESALQQASENRNAAIAAVEASFQTLTNDVLTTFEAKRAALTAELAVADAALDQASSWACILTEVNDFPLCCSVDIESCQCKALVLQFVMGHLNSPLITGLRSLAGCDRPRRH